MRRLLVSLFALAGLLIVPTATAHTTVSTSDGKYLVTVGNLNEPVTTYTKTGLDLIIRANNTARTPITGVHLTLNATLIAPNGEEHSEPLEARFGSPGSYTFEEPYYLTMPGEYFLRVDGRINQTQVNIPRILVGSGAVPAFEERGFPDDQQSPKQLQERIAMLEAKVAQLQAEGGSQNTAQATSPAVDSLGSIVLLGLVGLLVARARKTGGN